MPTWWCIVTSSFVPIVVAGALRMGFPLILQKTEEVMFSRRRSIHTMRLIVMGARPLIIADKVK